MFVHAGVFCDKLRIVPGKVGQGRKPQRSALRCGPGDEAMVERPKTQAYHEHDESKNTPHSRHSPLEKMSKCMLEIVLFFSGINKEQEIA